VRRLGADGMTLTIANGTVLRASAKVVEVLARDQRTWVIATCQPKLYSGGIPPDAEGDNEKGLPSRSGTSGSVAVLIGRDR